MRKKDISRANGTQQQESNYRRDHQQYGVFHIILRGFLGRFIFINDDDKIKFLRLLKRFLDKENSVIYAFVLMDNHTHLLLRTD